MAGKLAVANALAKRINACHKSCSGADSRIESAVLLKAQKARECGLFLIEQRSAIRKLDWGNWVRSNLEFGISSARVYMRFAKSNPDPILVLPDAVRSLRRFMELSHALTPAKAKDVTGGTIKDFFNSLCRELMGVRSMVEREIEHDPIERWTANRRASIKEQLAPLVALHARL